MARCTDAEGVWSSACIQRRVVGLGAWMLRGCGQVYGYRVEGAWLGGPTLRGCGRLHVYRAEMFFD